MDGVDGWCTRMMPLPLALALLGLCLGFVLPSVWMEVWVVVVVVVYGVDACLGRGRLHKIASQI